MCPAKTQSFGYPLTATSAALSATAPGWPGTQPFPATAALLLSHPSAKALGVALGCPRDAAPLGAAGSPPRGCTCCGARKSFPEAAAPANPPTRAKRESLQKVSGGRWQQPAPRAGPLPCPSLGAALALPCSSAGQGHGAGARGQCSCGRDKGQSRSRWPHCHPAPALPAGHTPALSKADSKRLLKMQY